MITDDKLRKVVNLLADPLQAHAAAHILAEAAKERGVLVSDLMGALAAPSMTTPHNQSYGPTAYDVDDDDPFDDDYGVHDVGLPRSTGRRINEDSYGLQAFIKHETNKAWLVQTPGGDDIWLPKSQCQHHGNDAEGRAILILPMWLVRKKAFTI
jgi:hypothetical protein